MFAKQDSKEPTTHGRLAVKNSTYARTAIAKCQKDRVMCILKTDSGNGLKNPPDGGFVLCVFFLLFKYFSYGKTKANRNDRPCHRDSSESYGGQ
ncbi:hypothetical protein [Serratia quinivorans]|uniref:hypothetical protein n=1 Tax=Serratia quinivorans TaxID=137545 RepID=UPI003F95BC1A